MSKRIARAAFYLLTAGCLWWLSGCSSDEGSGGGSPQTSAGTPGQSAGPAASSDRGSNPLIQTGPDGRKMFVDIPMEVWLDDPLAVAQNERTVPGGAASISPKTVPDDNPAPDVKATPQPSGAGDSAVAWDKVIPMPILDAEVKGIQNQLTQELKTIGEYNATYRDIPSQAYTLVAMAQIGERHPGDALWKKNAPALRELGILVADNAQGTGRTSYNAVQVEFEKIQGIFNGTAPDLAAPAEPMAPFGDKAEMRQIMYRMERAYKYLSSNTPTASSLTDAKEKVTHEVTVIGAILNVIRDRSYFISDDEKYQDFAKATLERVNGMQDGIANGDFDLFKENLGTMYAKCQNCHTEFKGE